MDLKITLTSISIIMLGIALFITSYRVIVLQHTFDGAMQAMVTK